MRFRLVPTDDKFFDLFNDSAQNVEDCARRLLELVGDPNSKPLLDEVIAAERKGDEITSQILHRLDTTFVTPFDREDIHALAEELDDVVDDIQQVAALIQAIPIDQPLPELREQAELLVEMAVSTVALIDRLESMKDTKSHLDRIDELESQGDAVHRRIIGRLFSGEFEALDVIKWKDIAAAMEHALNTLEDISDVVEAIVFKHA